MTIEDEIFKKTEINFDKLLKYGFKKENNLYKYSKNIMNDTFKVDVEINNDGIVTGKIYDLCIKEEYTSFRIENNAGSFIKQVKDEFKNILKDIKSKCFTNKPFIYEQANRIAEQIKTKYKDEPEFEWNKFPGYATFKNSVSKKWYSIIMNIDKSKIETKLKGEVEIIDIKLEPKKIEKLLNKKGFYPAYHMNKKSWITIILDDSIADKDIMRLIDESYSYTITNNEWIVPANPKYFDIEKALKDNNTITWKQSTNIKANDTIYLYVAKPYSSIMYKFKVIETNIPYKYKDKNIKIQKIMKIELIEKYKKGKLSFKKLKDFGINAVRGPRYMPKDLSKYINKKNANY